MWWVDDAHFYSADPFFEERPDNVAVARLYGISPSDMLRGNQVCMDCHGTIRTGRESREVSDGVSCENCHGAAGDYLEHHQEGDKALGAARPGYVAALQLGMTELRNLENRARTCSGCHLVTEPRLISAGHPTGESFDYVGGMLAIKHWEHPLAPTSELQTAVSAVLASRGPVPRPRPIAETVTTGTSSVASAVASSFEDTIAAVSGTAGGGRTIERKAQRPAVPRPRPRSRTATAGVGESGGFELDLPSLPAVGEVTSVDDVLLLVKERLEELYRVIKEK